MPNNPVSFIGSAQGSWKVISQQTITGEPLPSIATLDVCFSHNIAAELLTHALWVLRGTNNHTRYATRQEVDALKQRQEDLGRPGANYAALIPIRKNERWWHMAQDERRHIFEKESAHVSMSMDYLPAIARKLYHSRDLLEPFDFLTWFEFAPAHEHAFDALIKKLRASREWEFVDREIDIRLVNHDKKLHCMCGAFAMRRESGVSVG
jgi:chlorite dismutase